MYLARSQIASPFIVVSRLRFERSLAKKHVPTGPDWKPDPAESGCWWSSSGSLTGQLSKLAGAGNICALIATSGEQGEQAQH